MELVFIHFMEYLINRLASHIHYLLIGQFDVDKIDITEEHIDYYNNYYLKELEHDKFSTK